MYMEQTISFHGSFFPTISFARRNLLVLAFAFPRVAPRCPILHRSHTPFSLACIKLTTSLCLTDCSRDLLASVVLVLYEACVKSFRSLGWRLQGFSRGREGSNTLGTSNVQFLTYPNYLLGLHGSRKFLGEYFETGWAFRGFRAPTQGRVTGDI